MEKTTLVGFQSRSKYSRAWRAWTIIAGHSSASCNWQPRMWSRPWAGCLMPLSDHAWDNSVTHVTVPTCTNCTRDSQLWFLIQDPNYDWFLSLVTFDSGTFCSAVAKLSTKRFDHRNFEWSEGNRSALSVTTAEQNFARCPPGSNLEPKSCHALTIVSAP